MSTTVKWKHHYLARTNNFMLIENGDADSYFNSNPHIRLNFHFDVLNTIPFWKRDIHCLRFLLTNRGLTQFSLLSPFNYKTNRAICDAYLCHWGNECHFSRRVYATPGQCDVTYRVGGGYSCYFYHSVTSFVWKHSWKGREYILLLWMDYLVACLSVTMATYIVLMDAGSNYLQWACSWCTCPELDATDVKFVKRNINSLRPSDAYMRQQTMPSLGSDNGLPPGWHQAIIWTNAGGLLSIETLGIDILIDIQTFSFKKKTFENVVSIIVVILSRP